ncbi:unnamed protein product [Coffea canephora]|uniref:Uncharacterized protein n=1 Tax=Coffea canephora TaxID=49390 RepID=A0A068UHM5_COFCA|nr:unnamed protein product [Coffea canephora]
MLVVVEMNNSCKVGEVVKCTGMVEVNSRHMVEVGERCTCKGVVGVNNRRMAEVGVKNRRTVEVGAAVNCKHMVEVAVTCRCKVGMDSNMVVACTYRVVTCTYRKEVEEKHSPQVAKHCKH